MRPRPGRADRTRALLAASLLALLAPAVPAPVAAAPGTLVAPPRAHTFGVRRVTAREVGMFVPGAKLEDPGGIAATRLAATDDPDDPGDDDEVTIVAVDRGSGMLLTNFGLLRVGTWTGAGTAMGRLDDPWDVAIDRAGRVAVTDRGNRRVVLLRHDGSSLEPVAVFDGFLEPMGIAADGDGGFWVCDRRFHTVFRLDTETGERTTFGLEVAFDRPLDVAAVESGERLAHGMEALVAIVDEDGGRLRLFGRAGDLRATRTAASLDAPGAAFDAIDIDRYGNVLACDRRGHRIHKLRADLLPLSTFGGLGTAEGQFVEPRGIAIHRRLGQVFVTERDGGQYLWVGTDVEAFAARDEGDRAVFTFRVTEESTLDIDVLDLQGARIAAVARGRRVGAGPVEVDWDGLDAAGRPVDPGDWLVEIRARATYASRASFERTVLKPFTLGLAAGAR